MFDPGDFGGMFSSFGGAFTRLVYLIIAGAAWILLLLVVAAILFLFVRFLLVATKAAQIYVAQNAPVVPATIGEEATSGATVVAPDTATAPNSTDDAGTADASDTSTAPTKPLKPKK